MERRPPSAARRPHPVEPIPLACAHENSVKRQSLLRCKVDPHSVKKNTNPKKKKTKKKKKKTKKKKKEE
ncbi:hypothetical protein NKI38_32865, partial [Mesorhizobium sp. M0621]|uniref:hypothetical protein n=1 Tax=Mesorhizobium sp. M0621 TaxID=2956974 RepID=UPI00333C2403